MSYPVSRSAAPAALQKDQAASLYKRWRLSLEAGLGVPFTSGNIIEPLRNGVEIFPAMLDAIDCAAETIEFLTFVYWTGGIAEKFAAALGRAAKRGVKVQVLLDALGARSMSKRLIGEMRGAGVEVEWFRPLELPYLRKYTHRTHRKVLICDGRVGFTGGVGIAEEWEGDARNSSEWRDTHFKIVGPAVCGLRGAFIANWLETGRPINPRGEQVECEPAVEGALVQVIRGAACVGWSDIATLFRLLCSEAERSLTIASAYFTPDHITRELLCRAAKRGVKVNILMPGTHTDYRVSRIAAESEFEPLLTAGVEIWKYELTMFHAKIILVDDVLCCIGSPNFNQRSMRKDEEVCLTVLEQELVSRLQSDFEEDSKNSKRIYQKGWRRRGILRKTIERLVHPFKPEM